MTFDTDVTLHIFALLLRSTQKLHPPLWEPLIYRLFKSIFVFYTHISYKIIVCICIGLFGCLNLHHKTLKN